MGAEFGATDARVFRAISQCPCAVPADAERDAAVLRHAGVVAFADRNPLSTNCGIGAAVRQGGLISDSADVFELWRRVAGQVDGVLKGAYPGDLPVEQATGIKFALNLVMYMHAVDC